MFWSVHLLKDLLISPSFGDCEQSCHNIVSCQSQTIDSDAIVSDVNIWGHSPRPIPLAMSPHKHVLDQSQCCDGTSPCGSYYDCKTHLSNNQREILKTNEQGLLFTR